MTPPDIVPDWYLMPFYAMLRSVPQKLVGVLVLFGAIVTLALRALARHLARALGPLPAAVQAVLLGFRRGLRAARLLRLAVVGCGVEPRRFSIPLMWVARLGTIYYYAYFWLMLPIIGLVETPLPLPDSIARSVLGSRAAMAAE